MVFQKKCTIEPGDVVAIELECGNCGASSTIPIKKLDPEDIARFSQRDCGFCHTPNGFSAETHELKTLIRFLEAAKALDGVMAGRNMKLKLGIRVSDRRMVETPMV